LRIIFSTYYIFLLLGYIFPNIILNIIIFMFFMATTKNYFVIFHEWKQSFILCWGKRKCMWYVDAERLNATLVQTGTDARRRVKQIDTLRQTRVAKPVIHKIHNLGSRRQTLQGNRTFKQPISINNVFLNVNKYLLLVSFFLLRPGLGN